MVQVRLTASRSHDPLNLPTSTRGNGIAGDGGGGEGDSAFGRPQRKLVSFSSLPSHSPLSPGMRPFVGLSRISCFMQIWRQQSAADTDGQSARLEKGRQSAELMDQIEVLNR